LAAWGICLRQIEAKEAQQVEKWAINASKAFLPGLEQRFGQLADDALGASVT
jgi:hypothetical protein